jgi:hypothetical protein
MQSTLGDQNYADRSTLHLVTNITPNARILHFIQYLADFMQPTVGEEYQVCRLHITRGDQYHPVRYAACTSCLIACMLHLVTRKTLTACTLNVVTNITMKICSLQLVIQITLTTCSIHLVTSK